MNTNAPHRRSSLRRRHLVAVAAAALLAVAAGCSDEQRRDLGEEDIRQSLGESVEQVAADQGLEVDGDLTCTADITTEGAVSASCDGTTTSGATLAGTLEGTADVDVDDPSCSGHLVVLVDGASAADEPAADCFDVG